MAHSHLSLLAAGRYKEFEILEELGGNAFARVYKVRAPGHPGPLALKVAHEKHLSTTLIKRVVREIAVLRSLSGPHVPRLHGSSIGEDHFYLLMDYVDGKPLDRVHPVDEPVAVADALKIGLQVCMGLVEAHARGVVHRNIEPGNVWIDGDGTVKLLDFGWARAWGVPWAYGTNATESQTLIGHPRYCQPEQLMTDELSPASDVYSVCTILYELLSGHSALFSDWSVSRAQVELGDNPVAWLEAHVSHAVPPIGRYPGCAGLPDSLVTVLNAGLAKDPAHRPSSAAELANRLGETLVEDLGALEPGCLEVRDPCGSVRRVSVLPGRRSVGSGHDADVQSVDDPDVAPIHAYLDWSGAPRPILVRPHEEHPVRGHAGGEAQRGPVTLAPGMTAMVGSTALLAHVPSVAAR